MDEKIPLEVVYDFQKRVFNAQKKGSTDFRMTIQEASKLSSNISLLITENLLDLMQMQKETIKDDTQSDGIVLQGGKW